VLVVFRHVCYYNASYIYFQPGKSDTSVICTLLYFKHTPERKVKSGSKQKWLFSLHTSYILLPQTEWQHFYPLHVRRRYRFIFVHKLMRYSFAHVKLHNTRGSEWRQKHYMEIYAYTHTHTHTHTHIYIYIYIFEKSRKGIALRGNMPRTRLTFATKLRSEAQAV